MPIVDGEYVTLERETIQDVEANQLLTQQPNANPRARSTYTYALQYALAATIAQEIEPDLQTVYNAAFVEDATDEELTKKARNLGVLRRDAQKATGVVTFSRSSNATQDYTIPSGTIVETLETNAVQFETTETVTLAQGTQSVDANIEALDGGADGNVGPDSIQSLPSKPSGVETVTNAEATGDPTLTDTNGDPLIEGRDRESDSALRKRVFDTEAVSEAPSAPGIRTALRDIDGVESVRLNVNDTNSTVNGIDPYTTEVVALGGATLEIAQTLRDVLSVTTLLRLQGGVNGTKVSETVRVDIIEDTVTVPFTRPAQTNLAIDIDIVYDEAYVGDSEVKNAIVNYIGGTFTDDATTTGLGIGTNVLVNEIENVAEDVSGVEYADVTLLDADGDSTDDTTTDADGVPIYNVGDNAIARVDADAITLNKTAR